MHLRKHTLTLLTTTDTTGVFTTTGEFELPVYAVRYKRGGTAISSTARIKLKLAASSWEILNVAASTGNWYRGPRTSVIVSTSGEVHEALVQYPAYGEKISVTVSASTKAGQGGTIEIWEGGV